MGPTIECFLLEPSNEAQESLRRFVFSKPGEAPCSHGYHNAEVNLGQVAWNDSHHGYGADNFDHADPRWPTSCPCGYVFQTGDEWQHNVTRLWVRKDTGQKWLLSEAPPGAMWFADWMGRIKEYKDKSPDGHILVVMTPGGEWNIDAKSTNGDGWTRTGVAPKVTANPSILCGRKPDGSWAYHGWLRNGKLVEC